MLGLCYQNYFKSLVAQMRNNPFNVIQFSIGIQVLRAEVYKLILLFPKNFYFAFLSDVINFGNFGKCQNICKIQIFRSGNNHSFSVLSFFFNCGRSFGDIFNCNFRRLRFIYYLSNVDEFCVGSFGDFILQLRFLNRISSKSKKSFFQNRSSSDS